MSVESSIEEQNYDVVIVGGGLAGISAAAYLSNRGKKIALLERGVLGGRAVTLDLKGFSFNFGAHAIYGRDTSILHTFEKELGINVNWRDFNPNKAKYDTGSELTDVPVNVKGLFRTKLLKGTGKLKFTYEIFKTILRTQKGEPHLSIGRWMEKHEIDGSVKEMMLTMASSNFFTNEPEKIPSEVYFDYYRRLFTTNKPVAYVGGGWQSLIQQFVTVIEKNGGDIFTKAKVESVETNMQQVTKIHSKKGIFTADNFIFCVPPQELSKIFSETKLSHILSHYSQFEPSFVFVYDVGLKSRLDFPYSYIYDKKNRMFITDISYYDEGCVPEGGQLLQAIAYINKEDIGNKEVMDLYQTKIEALYDKHFSGWREELVVPRISKRAVAQELKWVMDQEPMPVHFSNYRNLFFAGDWCEGKGQLSELSFTSAYQSCQYILNKNKKVNKVIQKHA